MSDSKEPLRIGALYSQTGRTAFVERTQLNATLLAIEEINAAGGICGREVVPVTVDAQSDPQRFSRIAEHLLDEAGVAMLIGCYMTNTRQAVVPVVERRGAALAYAACYEGFEYSPNVVYGGAVPNQHILMLARHLMANVGKRFYLVGTRYTFPIESNRVMMTLVAEQDGQTVAERYVKLDAERSELAAIVGDIKAKRPDVVFCTVVGEAASLFYQLCRDAGVMSDTAIASLTITEAEIALMPAGLAEGHLTAATYFQTIGTAANRQFVRNYKAKFGAHEPLNAMAETAYGLTHMVLAAGARAGSFAPAALRAALGDQPFEAPQGTVRLDADNSHFYLWPRIGRVEADGQFAIIEESPVAVKPDPYLINHTLADCEPTIAFNLRTARR
ncbi:transporter substrate-binding domain-containing protein [Chelatococcus reniformis]|uniref:Amino acid ABC substrate-binding protein n=1 Tax=Chelatococcus reniformis TaxID=1494448 RepID=A0A916UT37_9HYPH|nr:transporter substrate-binding domain-containing protein [Chelatococcus reniformis]GGC87074.1 amino acid ABC substrate-binding protein [Chelatococcus reniformis]